LGYRLGWTVGMGWGPEMLRDIAIATNFGTKMAINWLYVNDSD